MSKASMCVSSLQRMLDLSLTADVLAEELYSFPPETSTSVAKRELGKRGFDVAGVQDTESSRVLRYVRAGALSSGDCGACAESIKLEQAVAKMTPLRDCLRSILEHSRLFILGREGIEGIITRADLEKQPVRLLLFGVISTLEMAMLELIRQRFPDDEWIGNPHVSLPRAQDVHEDRAERDEEIDLADCLQIGDKAGILVDCQDILRVWAFDTKKAAIEFFDSLRKVRNNLAHAHHPASGSSWDKVVLLLERAQEILDLTMGLLDQDMIPALGVKDSVDDGIQIDT